MAGSSRPSTSSLLSAQIRRGCPAQWHLLGPAKPDPSAGHDERIFYQYIVSDCGEAAIFGAGKIRAQKNLRDYQP
jgi:hypothetical protein